MYSRYLIILFIFINCSSCMVADNRENPPLTHSAMGHTIHHNHVFSPDGQWVVFDGRNDDTKIGETSVIGLVNVSAGEEKIIYRTESPTIYGPGVGAASFSPVQDFVIFIHGLPGADEAEPYAMGRRTGVGIDIRRPFQPVMMDARDVTPPYTAGSLRGGTHSHMWSGDGRLISFTYNDELVDPDLRVVGVMVPYEPGVKVDSAHGNNSGAYYSAIVTEVVRNPAPGSDEISKAFDECWVGSNGYPDRTGKKVPYAIAFQGNVLTADGRTITEIFMVDIDPNKILKDPDATGREGERPRVPGEIRQRRLTYMEKGISDARHWLRSDREGKFIYALAKDGRGLNQILQVEVNSGKAELVSRNDFSINYPFNLDRDGRQICFIALNNVYVFDLEKRESRCLTPAHAYGKIVGAPSFSPDNRFIVYNQYRKHTDGQEYLQIVTAKLND